MVSLKLKEIFCYLYAGLLFISGIVLLLFSSYLCYILIRYYSFVPDGSVPPFIFYFLLGIIHIFVTWLAIKGPQREHDFHIILFIVVSLILLLAEFSLFVWCLVLWGEAKDETTQLLIDTFYDMMKNNVETKDWIRIQKKFHCCGLNGVKDYSYSNETCIKAGNVDDPNKIPGCKEPFIKYVKGLLINGAILGFICTLLHILGAVTYIVYIRSLKKKRIERINRLAAQQRNDPENQPINQQFPVFSQPQTTTTALNAQPPTGSATNSSSAPQSSSTDKGNK